MQILSALFVRLTRHARYMGTLLKNMDAASTLPWHRIINGQGRVSLSKLDAHGMNLQVALLIAEGVVVENGKVDLKRYQWRPDLDESPMLM